ncbi:hypothetical protein D9M72_566020 [compost metagenome]
MVFHFAAFAVGIDDIPEHADEFDALFLREVALELGGELVVIDRLAFGSLARFDQRGKRGIVELVVLLDDRSHLAPFGRKDAAVGFHDLETEGDDRHAWIAVLYPRRRAGQAVEKRP